MANRIKCIAGNQIPKTIFFFFLGEEVKKKWRNLRDTFAKYIKSNKNKTGQTTTKFKKWIWADQMEVFRPFLNATQTTSNVSDIYSEESTNIEPTELVEISEIPETEQTSPFTPTSNTISKFGSALESPVTPKENRKRKCEPSTSVQDIIKYFERKKKKEFDAIDQLFLAQACTIKTFSARRQIEVKMKIAQVIMEHELLHLEENTSE